MTKKKTFVRKKKTFCKFSQNRVYPFSTDNSFFLFKADFLKYFSMNDY